MSNFPNYPTENECKNVNKDPEPYAYETEDWHCHSDDGNGWDDIVD